MNNNIRKPKYISVKGAKLHNLKNISVEIPHNSLTVITGLSGSGKSTLAFDTIYAEGQRRFVESLSAYARQFLERMNKPDVDSISGLPPAVAIEQKPPSRNPRSTVGTSTEIYDYIRLLFGRIGHTICKTCGQEIRKDNPSTIINYIMNNTHLKNYFDSLDLNIPVKDEYFKNSSSIDSKEDSEDNIKKVHRFDDDDKLYILFPVNTDKENFHSEIKRCRELGFFRFIKSGSDVPIDIEQLNDDVIEGKIIDKDEKLFVLVDRLVLKHDNDSKSRIFESIELGLRCGHGKIVIRNLSKEFEAKYSTNYDCPECEKEYQEPEPRLFSFNNPYGACPKCQGFGRTMGIDEAIVFPDKNKSIKQGAIQPFTTPRGSEYLRELIRIATKRGIPIDVPIRELKEEYIDILWEGWGEYTGINGYFSMLEEQNYKLQNRVLISRYRGYTKCPSCNGSRIRTSARQVFVGGMNIPKLIQMPLSKLWQFFNDLKLSEADLAIVGQVLKELKWRIALLIEIGLNYLTLDRMMHTLSGGEAQRINLSTALGSALVGTLYVLDEPSIGLHPRDTQQLLDILYKLRNLGNTIIVVEHDPEIIANADYIIDIGPLAGRKGGEVIFNGTFKEMLKSQQSLTGKYLSGELKIPIPKKRSLGNGKSIIIQNPSEHNLRMDEVKIPLGCITVITGVSGSGKSTLVYDVLYQGGKNLIGGYSKNNSNFKDIININEINYIELIDQTSIGKSSRSTPITYTKVFDYIRDLYASTQSARQLGLKSGYFSFNVPGGRCEVCEGEGIVSVDMQFLPDVHLECEACKGTRYKKEARQILYKGKSIVEVLNMTVDEATEFFNDVPKIYNKLLLFQQVGLGYLQVGQPSSMLSGGESQRIKLVTHLEASESGKTLFLFDEPTTGLHLHDISRLLECFKRLVEEGHSVVIIEHNLHIISAADWIIDLGPEAGEDGGLVIAEGTPEQVAKVKESHTGVALKDFFKNNK